MKSRTVIRIVAGFFCLIVLCYSSVKSQASNSTAGDLSDFWSKINLPTERTLEAPIAVGDGTCSLTLFIPRMRRSPIRKAFKKRLGLRFTIPGTRYCGPGTDVRQMDTLGGPQNTVDYACRQHDIEYEFASSDKLIWEADEHLLDNIMNDNPHIFPLFYAFFTAKRIFESLFGSEYISNLEVCYVVGKSNVLVYSGSLGSDRQYPISDFRYYEMKWKQDVIKSWIRDCEYRQKHNLGSSISQCDPHTGSIYTGIPSQPSGATNASTPPPVIIDPDQTPQPAVESGDEGEEETSHVTSVEMDLILPVKPRAYSPCLLKIYAVKASFTSTERFKYVELGFVCPEGKGKPPTKLDGYALVSINPMDGNVNGVCALDDFEVAEPDPTNSPNDMNLRGLFTAGTVEGRSNKLIHESLLPDFGHTPVYIALLYLSPKNVKKGVLRNLFPRLPLILDNDGMEKIQTHTKDGVLYGKVCDETCGTTMQKLWGSYVGAVQILPSESTETIPDDSNDLALNMCGTRIEPMDHDGFVLSQSTPLQHKTCPDKSAFNFPFDFRRSSIQSDAQKLVVNAEAFCRIVGLEQVEGFRPHVVVAKILNLSPRWVQKTLNYYNTGTALVTPGKVRKQKRPVQDRIESFEADVIKRIIVDEYYAKDVAPLFDNIYHSFKEKYPNLQCSKSTFRKILHNLGYGYKKIGERAVLVQKPPVVLARGVYLKCILRNEALPNPRTMIYIDETWVDTSGRIGKGWMPRHFDSYREAAKFAYQHQRSHRSPRLIVLAAVDENGIIQESVRVYPVLKASASADYHQNVNTAAFQEWFENLMKILQRRGGAYLLVMDNASYHSSSTAPLLNARKQVLYDWLEQQMPKEEFPEGLRSFKSMRVWELKSMVKVLKQKYNYFRVEEIAATYGVQVVRLPPWNCDLNPIELCWKDVKHQIKKQNCNLNLQQLTDLATTVLKSYVNKEQWKNHLAHVKRVREQYWKDDKWSDTVPRTITPIRITTGNDDDDDEQMLEAIDEEWNQAGPTAIPAERADTDLEYDALNMGLYDDPEVVPGDWEAARAMQLTYDFFMGQANEDEDDQCPAPKRKGTELFPQAGPSKAGSSTTSTTQSTTVSGNWYQLHRDEIKY